MTPWWVALISALSGGMLGGAFSLWSVKVVQDRTDRRETAKLEAEHARDLHRLEGEKPSRLRPDRVAMLYEIGELLHGFESLMEIIFDGLGDDGEASDWIPVAADAGDFIHQHRKLDIRVRLLFQHEENMVDSWKAFGARLTGLNQTVEFGDQWVEPSVVKDPEANRKAHWLTILKVAKDAREAAENLGVALTGAMKRIDTE
ncbi:hypothetical protein AB0G04_24295 [Actinoplanes sp. NPDC023801]|uniref:hypothetical protein n=1 Tax=Actinoplanes sp. NPDC023801 TaxID=3154595 RepID=UPI0033DD498C